MISGDPFDIDELEAVDINLLRELSQEDEQDGGQVPPVGEKCVKKEGHTAPGTEVPEVEVQGQGQGSANVGDGHPTPSGSGSAPTGPSDGQPFLSYEEVLKQRIEARLEQETQEKAKTNHALRQALKDQQTARDTIPVTVALIDYLGELKEALENNPEQFYCSLDMPEAAEEETPATSPQRRKGL